MNKNIIYGLICISLLGLGASWVIKKANSSYTISVIKDVPPFLFKTQDGKLFSEKEFRNKITVLDFMFTSCPGPCPIMTNNMIHLYQDYEKVDEVQFVSITVDPNIDSEEILKQYANAHGVNDSRWQFLTSDLEAIKDLKKNGFMLYADELPRGHAVKFVLIDRDGRIRKYYDGTDKASMAVLRKDLNHLVKEI
jgi:protein SCO1/2